MELRNLCPHDIEIRINSRETIVIPRYGDVARIQWKTEYWKTINDIPIHLRAMRDVIGLPKEKAGILCVVSNIVQEKLADEREDLLSPDRLSAYMSSGKVKNVEKLVRWV